MNMIRQPREISCALPKTEELPAFDARDLIGDGVQARIMLDEQTYFLRITRAGKLILTK